MNRPLIPLLLLALAACGPANRPVVYHTLRAGAPGAPDRIEDLPLIVGPARFPDVLDRPQIVTGAGDGTVVLSETHRWASALEQDFLKVLAEDIGAQLGSHRVSAWGFVAPAASPFRLRLDVLRFQGQLGGNLDLKVHWILQAPTGKVKAERVSVITEPVKGQGYEALVAAHGKAVEVLAAEIATEARKR